MGDGQDKTSGADKKDTALDLYKLEYEQAAARYQNIYQSAWSNFSYLTAVAAGIIAFGSKSFSPTLTIVFATLPLFFWYFAVFVPANVYGDQVIERLRSIEETLNEKYGVMLAHFTAFDKRRGRREASERKEDREQVNKWWPVRRIVKASAILLPLMLLCLILLQAFGVKLAGESKPETYALAPADKPLAVQVVSGDEVRKLTQENEQLRRELDELKRSLESRPQESKSPEAGQDRRTR
jgi:hypothetical protein